MSPLFDVAGRVALVSGSSRGIGQALAYGLADAGAHVMLNGRDADRLESVRQRMVRDTGAEVEAHAFDVTDSAAVDAAIATIEDEVGPLSILVNNAGLQIRGPITEFADAEFSAWVRQRTPAGRWGRPEDLVGALLFLASAASDFVNGQIVYVDGECCPSSSGVSRKHVDHSQRLPTHPTRPARSPARCSSPAPADAHRSCS